MNHQNPPQCECHECTQIRWRTSLIGQIHGGAKVSEVSQRIASNSELREIARIQKEEYANGGM